MACTIINRLNDQRIRFSSRDAAERYAEIMGGGVHNWVFTTEPSTEEDERETESPKASHTHAPENTYRKPLTVPLHPLHR